MNLSIFNLTVLFSLKQENPTYKRCKKDFKSVALKKRKTNPAKSIKICKKL